MNQFEIDQEPDSEVYGGSPSFIQEHGCLVVLDGKLSKILQVSANIYSFLGWSVKAALASHPRDLLGQTLYSRMDNVLSNDVRLPGAHIVNRRINQKKRVYYVDAYRSKGGVYIEFEEGHKRAERQLLPALNQWLARVNQADHSDDVLDTLTQGVQGITGHNHVMAGQFQTDGSVLVVSESKDESTRSLLGVSVSEELYPLSLHAKYLRNPVRSIPNVNGHVVPLVPEGIDISSVRQTPDIKIGGLEAASPKSRRNFNSLGITGSLTIAIRESDRLWGMLVANHHQKRDLSPARRNAAVVLVQTQLKD